jgi:epoxyqueuosine reductase
VPFNLPHRVAAARAGMGTFGKNCLFYSRTAVRQGSWVLPIAVVVDRAFEPDPPTLKMGCPEWCRNACIAACPTRALKGDGRIDPRRCISYLSYYGEGLTPEPLREPMGLYVYGCDRCQNVCPRNAAWLAQDLPANPTVAAMEKDFRLERLLHMDRAYFEAKIWPRMFYMSSEEIWRWQMNAARAMGNTRDPKYIEPLADACRPARDERVAAMAAWALGRIGGASARAVLERRRSKSSGVLLEEIAAALARG